MLAGVSFRSGKLTGSIVLGISPGEPVADHLHVDEAIAQVNAADLALIPVRVDDLHADVLAENFVSQPSAVPCCRTADLFLGRRFLPSEFCAGPFSSRGRQRVPVSDCDDTAGQLVMRLGGECSARGDEHESDGRGERSSHHHFQNDVESRATETARRARPETATKTAPPTAATITANRSICLRFTGRHFVQAVFALPLRPASAKVPGHCVQIVSM